MRRIIAILRDYRLAEVEARGGGTQQLAEIGGRFARLDDALSAVPVSGVTDGLVEVMTSGDFTNAIQTFVSRQMLPGYQARGFNFEPFMYNDTLPNFMTVQRHQRRQFSDDLEHVGEKGTARPGSVVDSTRRDYRVYRWKKQYDFSMEALVNDDMGYFTEQATVMGGDARRTLEKHVSNYLFNATTVARLTALGALYFTNGRLTTARVSTGRMAFAQRTDAAGNPIVASLDYIVGHTGLLDTAATIQNSTLVPELATNAQNVVRGTFTFIEDPHLAGTAPTLPWMALTSPMSGANVRPFVLARRQGVPGPVIMRKRSDIERVTSLLGGGSQMAPIWGDFDTGDIVLKVHDEWGTYIDGTNGNLFDERGAYYSAATAP